MCCCWPSLLPAICIWAHVTSYKYLLLVGTKSWGLYKVGLLWMHQHVPLTTYCAYYSLAFWFFNWVLVINKPIQGQQLVSREWRSQEQTERKGENPAFDRGKKMVSLVLNSLMNFSKWSSPQGYWSKRWAVHLNPWHQRIYVSLKNRNLKAWVEHVSGDWWSTLNLTCHLFILALTEWSSRLIFGLNANQQWNIGWTLCSGFSK